MCIVRVAKPKRAVGNHGRRGGKRAIALTLASPGASYAAISMRTVSPNVNMSLSLALEVIWDLTLCNSGSNPSERDYLRTMHHPPGLCMWAYYLNRELANRGLKPVSISSVWVDHTPQCWYNQVKGILQKPSCELADLLIVAWDDWKKSKGRALLVQAKKGKNHSRIAISNASTRKELILLGGAPRFLLSRQTSVASGYGPTLPANRVETVRCRKFVYRGWRD